MDLESELRKAMAEQVAETSASPSLVTDVKRRHRRRRARVHAAAGVAAASVAALALVPTYQSFRATPAGSSETARPTDTVSALRLPERPSAPGLPASPSSKGRPGTDSSPKPEARESSGGAPHKPGLGGAVGGLPSWITYLPDGLASTGPCEVSGNAGRKTTTCGWRGGSGWVEIALVKGGGLTGPQDLMKSAGVPGRTSVRGTPALIGDRPGSARQVSWLARPGVGVTVTAAGTARDQLMRIAEGVRP
ncbi:MULTISPECIES: hypothetical protein [Actinomadura]|uniref:Uncharacterized protein n=1 Tax=Actinomadura madurae TaxID=1993 RepID=A0A1I5E991_9ACTN|nr:hypothetical protein [Actinomadura madurae]SFO08017.1 hypothetical protein SAMN04489713_10424 [Actinomadura madurae]SPT59829.1 Uncharacterised protein [Actinomadura madurae]